MTGIARIKCRFKLRIELQKADDQTLKITKDELNRELERRNKEKLK